MKALIVLREPSEDWAFLGPDHSPALLPFLDRPLLQHIVESLASVGVRHIAIAPLVSAEAVRRLVGGGRRWGIDVEIHAVQSESQIPAMAAALAGDENLLIVDGERLPNLQDIDLSQPVSLTFGGKALGWEVGSGGPAKEVSAVLRADDPEAYLESWGTLLHEKMPALVQTGRQKTEGVVVARGARVHPTARIHAPVYVGERCLIGADVVLGPNAFVGADSIIEDGATIESGGVMPHTYVGPRIELRRKFAYRSNVYDLDRKIAVAAIEEFLLGTTANVQVGPEPRERLVALLLGIVLLPIALIGMLVRTLLHSEPGDIGLRSVTLDFLCRFAPGVWSVVLGQLSLVGGPPLTPLARAAIDALAPGLADGVPVGLVSEAYLRFGPQPTEDELWASVAMAAASRDSRSRRGILMEYLHASFGSGRPLWQGGEA